MVNYFPTSHLLPSNIAWDFCRSHLVPGLWLCHVISHQNWILTNDSFLNIILLLDILCHEYPATLGLQDLLCYMLKEFIDEVDFGVGQLRPRILAWVLAELVSLPALLHLHHQGELSSTAPARLPNANIGGRQVRSLSLMPLELNHQHQHLQGAGPALLSAPASERGRLANTPALKTPGPALLTVTGSERQGSVRPYPCTHTNPWQTSGRAHLQG